MHVYHWQQLRAELVWGACPVPGLNYPHRVQEGGNHYWIWGQYQWHKW